MSKYYLQPSQVCPEGQRESGSGALGSQLQPCSRHLKWSQCFHRDSQYLSNSKRKTKDFYVWICQLLIFFSFFTCTEYHMLFRQDKWSLDPGRKDHSYIPQGTEADTRSPDITRYHLFCWKKLHEFFPYKHPRHYRRSPGRPPGGYSHTSRADRSSSDTWSWPDIARQASLLQDRSRSLPSDTCNSDFHIIRFSFYLGLMKFI